MRNSTVPCDPAEVRCVDAVVGKGDGDGAVDAETVGGALSGEVECDRVGLAVDGEITCGPCGDLFADRRADQHSDQLC
jgi:hypothetical protein